MKNYLRLSIINLKVAIKRFPFVIVSCAIAGVFAIFLAHETFNDYDIPAKILMSVVMFAFCCLIAKLALESLEKVTKRVYFPLLIIGALLSSAFGLFILDFDTSYSAIVYAAVMFSLIITSLAIPFLEKGKSGSHSFTNRMGWRFIITGIYTGVLIGGLAALLFAIQELLNVNLYDEIYLDNAIIVLALFSPMFFLSDINQYDEYAPNKLYKVLLVNILMPLLLAYTAVVYIYLIQIMFNNFEMPGGIVGNLVLWYSLVGIWVLYLSGVFLEKGFAKFFKKFYPIASLPPLAAMFIALFIRVNQYGFTESRYYSLVAGIWILGIIVYYIITKLNKNTVIVLVSLAVIAILSTIGPWSAGSVSLNSQSKRLEKILVENEILVDGKLDETKKISGDANNIIFYIDENHGFNKIDYLGQDQADNLKNYNLERNSNNDYHQYNEAFNQPRSISGYDYEFVVNEFDNSELTIDKISYVLEGDVITLFIDGEKDLVIDFNAAMQELFETDRLDGEDLFDFVVTAESSNLKAQYTIQYINFMIVSDVVKIHQFDGRMLVKVKNK